MSSGGIVAITEEKTSDTKVGRYEIPSPKEKVRVRSLIPVS